MTVYLVSVIKDILCLKQVDSIIICDNKSLVDAVYSTTNLEDKCLLLDVCVLRDMISKGLISSFKWVPGDTQLADCLTKQGASDKKLVNVLNGKLKMDLHNFEFG